MNAAVITVSEKRSKKRSNAVSDEKSFFIIRIIRAYGRWEFFPQRCI